VLTDGRVKCWGQNNVGQLGLGDQVREHSGNIQ
jgi:alpha-tubulin suppressor-like RCC1 family protein